MGLVPDCPKHSLHVEKLGWIQPSPHPLSSPPAAEVVVSTAYSAYFGDVQGRKGSAERQNHGHG